MQSDSQSQFVCQTNELLRPCENSKCIICDPITFEIELQLRSLMLELEVKKQQLESSNPDRLSDEAVIEKSVGALAKLVNFLFCQRIIEASANLECQHRPLTDLLVEAFECDQKVVDVVADELYEAVVRRNYELDVLNNQVREIGKNVMNETIKKVLENSDDFIKGENGIAVEHLSMQQPNRRYCQQRYEQLRYSQPSSQSKRFTQPSPPRLAQQYSRRSEDQEIHHQIQGYQPSMHSLESHSQSMISHPVGSMQLPQVSQHQQSGQAAQSQSQQQASPYYPYYYPIMPYPYFPPSPP